MNMTIRKETLRDQRAHMLAASPGWRASDARVNPRVAIGSIIAMWLIYFLITTGLALLAGPPSNGVRSGAARSSASPASCAPSPFIS